MVPNFSALNEHFQWALREDVGEGDHSARACIPAEASGKAHLLIKQEGIVAGIALAQHLFSLFEPQAEFEPLLHDGDRVSLGDIAFVVKGPSRSLLTIERLVLNYMQRLSGIATLSGKYAAAVAGTKAKVLDTRKTTPGLRILEKWAVQLGGCYNHRMGLYDMVMLKDNHIDFCGGIAQAIQTTHEYLKNNGLNLNIEIEVRNEEELDQVLRTGGVQRIMLDNFSPERTLQAVSKIGGQYEIESSGGITLETIRRYAECGVDYISVGALTHQIGSLDMSLKAF